MAKIKLTIGKKENGRVGYRPSIVLDGDFEVHVSDEFMYKKDALRLANKKMFDAIPERDWHISANNGSLTVGAGSRLGVPLGGFTERYIKKSQETQ